MDIRAWWSGPGDSGLEGRDKPQRRGEATKRPVLAGRRKDGHPGLGTPGDCSLRKQCRVWGDIPQPVPLVPPPHALQQPSPQSTGTQAWDRQGLSLQEGPARGSLGLAQWGSTGGLLLGPSISKCLLNTYCGQPRPRETERGGEV